MKLHILETISGFLDWRPLKGKDGAALVDASPDGKLVTRDNATDDPNGPFLGMRFDVAGNVSLESGGETHALTASAGEYWPGTVTRVNLTGTQLADSQMTGFSRV